MKRVSLFLKENQIKKAKALAEKMSDRWQTVPWSAIVRDALDFYFLFLKEGNIKLHLLKDGRVKPRDFRRESDIAARALARIRKEKDADPAVR